MKSVGLNRLLAAEAADADAEDDAAVFAALFTIGDTLVISSSLLSLKLAFLKPVTQARFLRPDFSGQISQARFLRPDFSGQVSQARFLKP
jgi:hypothetical protein